MNSSHAQIGTILTRLTAQRLLTNTNITTKTGARSITPLNVGYSDDSIMAIMYDLAGLSGAAGDLAAVTALGNTTTLLMKVFNSGAGYEASHAYNTYSLAAYPSSNALGSFGIDGGIAKLRLYSTAAGYSTTIQGTGLTADRAVLLPDEGDGVGLDATLVTHTTEDPITISATGSTATHAASGTVINDGLGDQASIYPTYLETEITAGTTTNKIKHHPTQFEYKYTNSVGSITKSTFLHFDRTSFTSGSQDVWFPSATNDTLAVKGDITAMGNFATVDLTLTGNRYHNVDRYNVDIDSANMFVIQDTSGNYALNINDTANYGNSLIYVSGRTDKTVRITPSTTFASRVFLQANSTQNLGQFHAGSAQIGLTQISGTNIIGLSVGAGTPAAQLQVDSTTKCINVTHLGGLVTSAPTIAAGTGAGTAPTVSVGSGSTDLSGYVNITTGTTCATDATVATITFNVSYASAPKCIMLSPANKAAQNLAIGQQCFVNQAGITTAVFNITSNTTALTDATAYQWYYTVIQ